ncbi:50S ribosomal protein L25 [Desulfovibrio mangrovi]|uniref:50S ribosomal protein L25 n=1 Tax=Desulfovibrio mangrovi TaxID=2976983 RepID=UPI00224557C7|nr:50S ribosomal protein L25 [Desulfovibrio mangrovi]UZP68489.1 50S ribosomal protein L25 [Desulfovibrio mangrovi]
MSERITYPVKKREGLGKGANRRLREEGLIPGIFYSTTGENIPVTTETLPFSKLFKSVGKTTVFNLDIEGESKPCMLWKVEMHPFKNRVQHIDFYGVDLEKEISVKVEVKLAGSSKGVKAGGRLEHYRNTVTITGKPELLPPFITVDITEMQIDSSVFASALQLPEGVRVVYDTDFVILRIVPGRAAATEEAAADTGKKKKK